MQKFTVISLSFTACCWMITPAQGQLSQTVVSEGVTVCEQVIRVLDTDHNRCHMSAMLLTEPLSATEHATPSGLGMNVNSRVSLASQVYTDTIAQQEEAPQGQNALPASEPSNIEADGIATKPLKKKKRTPLIAIKTDLLRWGGVMPSFEIGSWTPNLSVEYYFAYRWSVQAGFAYSNWNALSGSKELYAVSVSDLEMRYWICRCSEFRGFYLGVYGQFGDYDVQKGITGQTGNLWGTGIGVGWLQPLSNHWAIEAQVRGGYRSTECDVYDIEDRHAYLNRKEPDGTFAPQLRLQVVYRFGKPSKK